MTVETWDPQGGSAGPTARQLERLREASRHLDQPLFGLDEAAAAALAPVVRQASGSRPGADWEQAAAELSDEELVALIRLFTLAEAAVPGWEAGDASPVVPLAAALKARGAYPADLTAWIRANSDNRFLPYGNLMNRL